jgi:hypothetical protein
MARKKKANNSRLIYIPFGVLAAVIIAMVVLGSAPHPAQAVTGQFFKVGPGHSSQVEVYFISWIGCPIGASLSWPLDQALGGHLNVTTNLSTPSDVRIPGLIFNSGQGANVTFFPIYVYNEYLNASPNGTPVTGNRIQFGLQVLKPQVPSWVYNIMVKYDVNTSFELNGNYEPLASYGNHLTTVIIITGPRGTWILLGGFSYVNGYFQELSKMSPQQLYEELQSGHLPYPLEQAAQQIEQTIQEAS